MPVEERIDQSRRELLDRGRLITQSGAARLEAGWLSVHSDYGPAGQDKSENQDFALLWLPAEDRPRNDLHWAAALADGVTCSFRPEWGAKLACFRALASLVSGASPSSPFERAVTALNSAGDALGELARQIAKQGDDFRPADEFPVTWRMRLERGQLLQTTLTLAWLDGETLSVAMIGDGGAALRAGQDVGSDEMVLASGEPELDLVHALGPANCSVEALDLWHESPFTPGVTLALYTDGIRTTLESRASDLLSRATELLLKRPDENVAEILVRELMKSESRAAQDNLTLLVAQRI